VKAGRRHRSDEPDQQVVRLEDERAGAVLPHALEPRRRELRGDGRLPSRARSSGRGAQPHSQRHGRMTGRRAVDSRTSPAA
jgi:hypothetical protein